MGRKNAYLVILRAHVDETQAIAGIVRSRVIRRIAEADLAQKRIQRTARQWRTRIKRVVSGKGIDKSR